MFVYTANTTKLTRELLSKQLNFQKNTPYLRHMANDALKERLEAVNRELGINLSSKIFHFIELKTLTLDLSNFLFVYPVLYLQLY